MNTSSEAADQIVRMTLNGTETALKITGAGAEKIMKLMYRLLRDLATENKKTKGQMRLSNLIKSGKKLEIYEVPDENLRKFCSLAKKYGVTYSILKDKSKNDGLSEIMIKAEDTQKINHIFRRLNMALNNVSNIEGRESEKEEHERAPGERSREDRFIDELMRSQNPAKEEHQSQNPTAAWTEKSNPSVPSSKNKKGKRAEKSEDEPEGRASVREELKKYKEEEKVEETKTPEKPKKQQTVEHKKVEKKKKPKTKEK